MPSDARTPQVRSPLQRVLYVWQARYPWDVRVEKICNGLKRNGIDVEILARRGVGEPAFDVTAAPEHISIHRVGPERPRALSLPVPGNPIWERAIAWRVREFKPDIIIARDIPLALPCAKVGLKFGVPMVIDMAEHYPVAMRTWKKYQSSPVWKMLINTLKLPDLIERESVRKAAGVLPVCEEQKQRLIREYGCPAYRIVPVLNTPEKSRIPAIAEGEVRRKGAVFGYHGVVIQDRDLLTVVRGFDLAASQNAEIRLTISGGGESMDDVKAEVQRARHGDRISLTGPFKPGDLARLYSEIDFGVVSWKVNDFTNNTIANKFFDYAAFGKPVLYTRTHPMESLMQTMRFGVGFDGDDPRSVSQGMLELLKSDYGQLARNGRAAVEREFNWEEDVRKMIDFLSGLPGTA
jgi:glycosyltransferase involved in cell wall biosynthesis